MVKLSIRKYFNEDGVFYYGEDHLDDDDEDEEGPVEEDVVPMEPAWLVLFRDPQRTKQANMTSKKLMTVPREIGMMQRLERLSVNNNAITCLPHTIGNCTSLKVVHLGRNLLEYLPMELFQLPNLQTLQAFNNVIKDLVIPAKLAHPSRLTLLNLNHNNLASLPPTISQLSCLTSLSIDNNELTTLPSEVCELVKLEHLSACGNHIRILPPTIHTMKCLKKLILIDNLLESIPIHALSIKTLRELDVSLNRIESIDKRVVMRCQSKKLKLHMASNPFRKKGRTELSLAHFFPSLRELSCRTLLHVTVKRINEGAKIYPGQNKYDVLCDEISLILEAHPSLQKSIDLVQALQNPSSCAVCGRYTCLESFTVIEYVEPPQFLVAEVSTIKIPLQSHVCSLQCYEKEKELLHIKV
eukprot:m.66854 g.66854  ORF g.66854 m.66854 type:complete len:412 (-) comp8198_c2_seq1:6071-7306(-)